ncbi:MAG: hypothetical protein N2515_07450 [Deltaproteobacteria bacterium]|nr:hypothetical protein [Deltaproteobacteria bacterium]
MHASTFPTLCGCAFLTLALLAGCGASPAAPSRPPPQPKTDGEHVTPSPPSNSLSQITISRSELRLVLDAGPAAFLARLELAPELVGGRFIGHRLIHSRDERLLGAGKLEIGDVIQSVNGFSVERLEEAFEAWSSLRVASELSVRILRKGEVRELRFPIVED